MANNVTNPNPFQAPPISQVATQSIVGHPTVQAPPATSGVVPGAGTLSGGASPSTYDQNKGKGNK